VTLGGWSLPFTFTRELWLHDESDFLKIDQSDPASEPVLGTKSCKFRPKMDPVKPVFDTLAGKHQKSHCYKNGVIFEHLPPELDIFQFGAKIVFPCFSGFSQGSKQF
jgi:hypothetical protein